MNEAEFDRFADRYEVQHRANIAITGETPEFFAAYKLAELARLAAALAPGPRRILDFGSGIGNSIPFFREHFPQAALTCADASSRSLELSRRRLPGPERYLLVEGREIPAEAESFDVVFSACVFHHIPHEEHAHWLRELRRVTRPGGFVTIFEHNPLNPLTVRAVNTCPFDENARLLRAQALLRALRAVGWVEAAARYHVFFPHALAPLRPAERYLGWLPLGAQYSATARNP
jgi:ubiquinone/menaquinone biosynthesis C-methylase UbiE